ncbi:SET domain protein [Apiospora kogelbergensis]|uniref:SET domain protein n=1 Tax=Apiospora kogelbergensis TaxID=1337665 RepID=A0AAW0R2D4_9PEZI
MEGATKQHFFFHGLPGREAEKSKCHFCQIRSFTTHAEYPITITNIHDELVLEPGFRFVQNSHLGRGVQRANDEFRVGCDCQDAEECQYEGCTCLDELEGSDEEPDEDNIRYRRKKYAYHSHGVKAGHLRTEVLESRDPIYECHDGCACGPDCPNRFIDKYLGEIITPKEAARRRAKSDISQRKDVYLFALDKFSDPESPDERLRGPPLEVDGEFMSGPTRFINHSCDPNLRIFARVGDHADKHIHDLAFFAIRDIAKGTELTFDYVDGVEDSQNDAMNPATTKDMTPCLCGSKKCRGYLW